MTTTEHHYDYLISVLGRIREVTGVGHKPILSELPEAIAQVISDLKAQPKPPASAVECAREVGKLAREDWGLDGLEVVGIVFDEEKATQLITAHTAAAVAEAREKALEEAKAATSKVWGEATSWYDQKKIEDAIDALKRMEEVARAESAPLRGALNLPYILEALECAETEMRYAGLNQYKSDNEGQLAAYSKVETTIKHIKENMK